MDSADFGHSSVAGPTTILMILMPRGLQHSVQRVMSAVGVDASARTFALDDLDGVAFAGLDVVERCLAGSDRVALPANSEFLNGK